MGKGMAELHERMNQQWLVLEEFRNKHVYVRNTKSK
jgi:hypothetical protein